MKPVALVFETRPEAIKAGTAKLVGTDFYRVIKETLNLLNSKEAYDKMSRAENPFGDGTASIKIVKHLVNKM